MAKKKKRKSSRKAGRKSTLGKSMTPILSSLNRAFEDASRQAFKETLASLPGSTLVGRFLDQLATSEYMDHLRSLSLEELAEAIRRAPRAVLDRAPTAKEGESTPTAPRSKGKYNTRTGQGRAQIDKAVATFLAKAKEASAEQIRASVGGSAAQVRESLTRLAKAKKVGKKGQRRGTRYIWKG